MAVRKRCRPRSGRRPPRDRGHGEAALRDRRIRAARGLIAGFRAADIVADDQQAGKEPWGLECRFAGTADHGRSSRIEANSSRGHLAAVHLGTVPVDDGAVVAQDPERESRNASRSGAAEVASEIGRDVPIARRAAIDCGRLVPVAIPQWRGAGSPASIREGGRPPSAARVAWIVVSCDASSTRASSAVRSVESS